MAAADNRATLVKLLDALRAVDEEYAGKRGAILAEMSTLLHGGEGIGPKITRLKKDFQRCWLERYRSEYVFDNHAMVGATLKRWLTGGHSENEIAARMFAYIKSDDRFYVQTRHSFAVFVKAFNQLVGLPAPNTEQDDAAMQRQREMRGQ